MAGVGRSWIFVINNYTDEDVSAVTSVPAKRIICGKEVGESGTPHLQGAIVFSKAHRAGAVCRMLGGRAHVEKMRGKWSDQDYCGKDGEIVRQEDNSAQGQRTDLEEFRDAIKAGATTKKLYEEHTSAMMRYYKSAANYQAALAKEKFKAWRDVKVTVLWGVGGTGKSRMALYNNDGTPKENLYVVPQSENLKWWCGYEGEDEILIDEFRGSTCTFGRWLRLMDGHRMQLETKGGLTHAGWTKVWITSNISPDDWWLGYDRSMPEFARRIHEVIEF